MLIPLEMRAVCAVAEGPSSVIWRPGFDFWLSHLATVTVDGLDEACMRRT